jgi:ABC-type uncharacterized transport system permease subunit
LNGLSGPRLPIFSRDIGYREFDERMESVATIAFYLGVIAYSAASTLFFLELVRSGGVKVAWAPRLLALGGALHATHVTTASLFTHTCPVESMHFALSFSALMAVGAFLIVYRRFPIHALGAVVAPLALTFLVGSQFVGRSAAPDEAISRPLLALHIAANVVGVGLFMLAAAAGIFYVVEERRLKRKQLGMTTRMPPLATLDKTAHRLLLAGFPLLTFGVVTGSLFLDHLSGMNAPELVRSLLGYASWLVLALVLLLRRLIGWSGRRAAYGTLAGVGCVLLVMLFYVFRVAPG